MFAHTTFSVFKLLFKLLIYLLILNLFFPFLHPWLLRGKWFACCSVCSEETLSVSVGEDAISDTDISTIDTATADTSTAIEECHVEVAKCHRPILTTPFMRASPESLAAKVRACWALHSPSWPSRPLTRSTVRTGPRPASLPSRNEPRQVGLADPQHFRDRAEANLVNREIRDNLGGHISPA